MDYSAKEQVIDDISLFASTQPVYPNMKVLYRKCSTLAEENESRCFFVHCKR